MAITSLRGLSVRRQSQIGTASIAGAGTILNIQGSGILQYAYFYTLNATLNINVMFSINIDYNFIYQTDIVLANKSGVQQGNHLNGFNLIYNIGQHTDINLNPILSNMHFSENLIVTNFFNNTFPVFMKYHVLLEV